MGREDHVEHVGDGGGTLPVGELPADLRNRRDREPSFEVVQFFELIPGCCRRNLEPGVYIWHGDLSLSPFNFQR